MLENTETKVGGMITKPIFKKDKKTGFEIVNWMTKEKMVLGRFNPDADADLENEQFDVEIKALETIGVKPSPRPPRKRTS